MIDRGMRLSGYALLEATATAQLARDYLAVVRIEDALDVRPETRLGYHSAGRVISVVLQGTWH
jgi:outer membrane cobalamin receptor